MCIIVDLKGVMVEVEAVLKKYQLLIWMLIWRELLEEGKHVVCIVDLKGVKVEVESVQKKYQLLIWMLIWRGIVYKQCV
ncbi:hypothetical protein Hanom_Chr14g01323671 [Helianthus anomalus]